MTTADLPCLFPFPTGFRCHVCSYSSNTDHNTDCIDNLESLTAPGNFYRCNRTCVIQENYSLGWRWWCCRFVLFLHTLTLSHCLWSHHKLQALVYNILPPTTAVFSYAIGSRKLSAEEQFFVGAQTVVSLLQTTQIKQGVSFIAANKV